MWDRIINIHPSELLSTKTKESKINESFQVEIDPPVNKLEFMNIKKPSKPNLSNVLEPSKLLLSMDFLESCLH